MHHSTLFYVLADGFALAKYYSSYMVLQRAPARPRVWGYADNIGDTVQVAIVGRETVTATATLGKKSLQY